MNLLKMDKYQSNTPKNNRMVHICRDRKMKNNFRNCLIF